MIDFEIGKIMFSSWWKQQEGEESHNFHQRKKDANKFFDSFCKEHGVIVLRFKEIQQYNYLGHIYGRNLYTCDIIDNFGNCKICFNFRNMRIVDPCYNNGFVDKGGVYAKCLCMTRGLIEKTHETKKQSKLKSVAYKD